MDDSFVLLYVCGPVHSANLMVLSSAGNVTLRSVWMQCYKLDEEIRQSMSRIAFYTTSHHHHPIL